MNRGYVNFSRSARSQEALENFEVPLSLINRSLINDFLESTEDQEIIANINFLKNVSVCKWKFAAKEFIDASSWHHTSKFFNKTNHYKLRDIAESLIENKEILNIKYSEYLKEKKQTGSDNVVYGFITVQIWGGTKKHLKYIGTEETFGIVKGNWLYYNTGHGIYKYKTNGNKVVSFSTYDSYKELKKSHKEVQNKSYFNEISDSIRK